MINNVSLVGRITSDLELKKTSSGREYTRFTLAVNRPFQNNEGENEADFIGCVTWGKSAENLVKYQGKGSLIGLIGRIQTGSYTHEEKGIVYTTDVVAENIQYLGSKKDVEPTDLELEEAIRDKKNELYKKIKKQHPNKTQAELVELVNKEMAKEQEEGLPF